jgi:hypothetical protein
MPQLTLPPATSGTLRAFWLIVSLGSGAAVGLGTAAVARRRSRALIGVPLAAVVAAVGFTRPQDPRIRRAYSLWHRSGRRVNRIATGYVTTVGFRAMLLTRGVGAPAELPLRSPGTTGWIPRGTQPASSYAFEDVRHGSEPDPPDEALQLFAEQPGREWASALRPLVRLLAALRDDEDADEQPPSNIYTLY